MDTYIARANIEAITDLLLGRKKVRWVCVSSPAVGKTLEATRRSVKSRSTLVPTSST